MTSGRIKLPGTPDDQAMSGLRIRWAAWTVLGALVLAICGWILGQVWPGARAATGSSVSLLLWAYLSLLTFRYLPSNRRDRDRVLLHHFGPGTALTLLRGVLLAALAGFWILERPEGWLAWIPAGLYTLAALIDYVDGYAARRSDSETALGERLDMESDALGLLVAVGLAVRYGKLPWPFLAIGIARYLFVWTQVALERRGDQTDLPESVSRRPIAGITMGFVSASLWPVVTPAGATLAGTIFLSAFALSFVRDWLVVTDLIDPSSSGYQAARRAAKRFLFDKFPILVRAVVAVSGIAIAPQLIADPGLDLYLIGGLPLEPSGRLLTVVLAGTAVMMVIGLLARSAAFIHFFPLGLLIAGSGLTSWRIPMLVSAVLILLLGSGDGSLWDPERRVFARRAGAAASRDA